MLAAVAAAHAWNVSDVLMNTSGAIHYAHFQAPRASAPHGLTEVQLHIVHEIRSQLIHIPTTPTLGIAGGGAVGTRAVSM